ncbi:hypothetical protein EDD17DRAFT_1050170 [Pisolithus thermaeus]|nr:hypothetical protein EDD17DRAFT_1050170 [Pisolithus thermaeus]
MEYTPNQWHSASCSESGQNRKSPILAGLKPISDGWYRNNGKTFVEPKFVSTISPAQPVLIGMPTGYQTEDSGSSTFAYKLSNGAVSLWLPHLLVCKSSLGLHAAPPRPLRVSPKCLPRRHRSWNRGILSNLFCAGFLSNTTHVTIASPLPFDFKRVSEACCATVDMGRTQMQRL